MTSNTGIKYDYTALKDFMLYTWPSSSTFKGWELMRIALRQQTVHTYGVLHGQCIVPERNDTVLFC